MLTYTAATSYVADVFVRKVRVRFRVTVYTQLALGVYWDSTPLTASVPDKAVDGRGALEPQICTRSQAWLQADEDR